VNQQEIRARRLVTLIKQWTMEARTICPETEDPKECQKLMEQLFMLIKKFENRFVVKS